LTRGNAAICKRDELLRQLPRSVDALCSLPQMEFLFRCSGGAEPDHFHVQNQARQEVVEIMRNPARENTGGFQLTQDEPFSIALAPLGDITRNGEHGLTVG
jgi:hypothetical protein